MHFWGPDGLFEKGFGYVCQSLTGLPVDHFLGYTGPFSCHFRVDLGSLLALFCLRFAILLYPFDNFSPRWRHQTRTLCSAVVHIGLFMCYSFPEEIGQHSTMGEVKSRKKRRVSLTSDATLSCSAGGRSTRLRGRIGHQYFRGHCAPSKAHTRCSLKWGKGWKRERNQNPTGKAKITVAAPSRAKQRKKAIKIQAQC